jgi:hypothetical protein
MKRNSTGERWGKASKNICSSSKLITMWIDPEKPESIFKKKKKSQKDKIIYEVWDTVTLKSSSLYSHPRSNNPVRHWRMGKELNRFIRDNSAIRWYWYLVNIIIDKVITEWKVTTYYGKYWDFNVCFDDWYTSITKL